MGNIKVTPEQLRKVEARAQETSYVRTDIPYMEDITVTQKMHDFSSIVGYDEYTPR